MKYICVIFLLLSCPECFSAPQGSTFRMEPNVIFCRFLYHFLLTASILFGVSVLVFRFLSPPLQIILLGKVNIPPPFFFSLSLFLSLSLSLYCQLFVFLSILFLLFSDLLFPSIFVMCARAKVSVIHACTATKKIKTNKNNNNIMKRIFLKWTAYHPT